MKTRITLLLLLAVFQLKSLDLERAKTIALKNNPELQAEKETALASKNELWKNYLSIIPSASLNGGWTKFENEQQNFSGQNAYDAQYSYQLNINQPIFNGGKVWLGIGLNRDLYQIAKKSLKSKRLNVITEVEKKYYAILENQALLEIARKDLQTSRTNKEIAQVRLDAGTLSQAEFLQLQSELANKEVTLIQREALYQTSKIDLQNYLQLAEMEKLEKIDSKTFQPELEKLQNLDSQTIEALIEKLRKIGFTENPNLQMTEIGISSNQKSVLMTAGNFLPTLNLQYLKGWSKYEWDDEFQDTGIAQIGLNISLPIFPVADNVLELAQSKHNLKKAKFEYQALENNIDLSIQNTFLNLIAAAKTVYSAEIASQYAQKTFEQMKERFRNGIISANELLSAEVMLNSSQTQYISSFYNYLMIRVNLIQLLGSEDQKLLTNMIE